MKAIIIGGGIGGLTAAIALRQVGIQAEVYERVEQIGAVGAGLTLWPNAMSVLHQLGVAAEIHARGAALAQAAIRDWRGKTISTTAGKAPTLAPEESTAVIHRAELHHILHQAAGPEHVHLNAQLAGYRQDANGVTAEFAGGHTVQGDLLVGADGIHSVVRQQLLGQHSPRYSGYLAWRAVAEFSHPDLPASQAFESWGPGGRFGAFPLGNGRVYWFATANLPPGSEDAPGGRKHEVQSRFAGWHSPIEALIAATPEADILRNDIYDHPPAARWVDGRVALLGDAAHATTPNMGQGACQAVESAWVLADCLRQHLGDLPAALQQYQTRRIERASMVTNMSWRIGQAGQLENRLLCGLRNAVMGLVPAGMQRRQMEGIILPGSI